MAGSLPEDLRNRARGLLTTSSYKSGLTTLRLSRAVAERGDQRNKDNQPLAFSHHEPETALMQKQYPRGGSVSRKRLLGGSEDAQLPHTNWAEDD